MKPVVSNILILSVIRFGMECGCHYVNPLSVGTQGVQLFIKIVFEILIANEHVTYYTIMMIIFAVKGQHVIKCFI